MAKLLFLFFFLQLSCSEEQVIREPASVAPKRKERFRFPEEEFQDHLEEDEFNKVV